MPSQRTIWLSVFSSLVCLAGWAVGKERVQRFDKDPGWEGRNNRASSPPKRTVRQDFGYSRTANAGGKVGEIGGHITAAAEPAWYARKIGAKSFDDPLTASGRLACKGGRRRNKGKRSVLFVDAARFVYGPYLGCLWCLVRLFVPGPSGRKRHDVPGAIDAVTHRMIRVTNHAYVNSSSVCDLLKEVSRAGKAR